MATHTSEHHKYYVPEPSPWPFMLTVALFLMLGAAGFWLNGSTTVAPYIAAVGLAMVLVMVFIWFRDVVHENRTGAYGVQEDRTYRYAMMWFIFSEVMFFAAFFGALFYTRMIALPWLNGEGEKFFTNVYLWPQFEGAWPTNGPGNIGGDFETVNAWHLPLINTLLLLTSSVTITWAHWGLKEDNRWKLCLGLAATAALGAFFLYWQAVEYIEAYEHLGLTLGSGIYGSTFFLLTGFHGMHVTLGTLMLIIILLRCLKGHFSSHDHFGFEAVAWYWHFVDVVWLGLFIFVYIL
ncbi:Cytochrome C oxidase subunit III protein [Salinisphaera shabanensis E1L3A]|jgi:cytochrome c oxidase subunit 3|uniref:cytochrome-c oxidase n=1 Tax=Salinisphaera shabanensis E1L3A TaxID=1033802 RepID=U2EHH9_9GAMM|nr:cytochrome c oxidase subunit 3 [Salinisphaera shabanensis]ERJ17842.1 Cytochrome C oxidase subunit III protein [Salinisphaera shabanensis E1L3A]